MKMYVGRGPKEYIFLDNFFVAEAGTDFIIEKGQRHKCVFFQGGRPGWRELFPEQRGVRTKALRLDLVVTYDLSLKESVMKFF